MSLADVQAAIRDVLVAGSPSTPESLHGGRGRVADRLAIHRRHFHASLVTAIMSRFPATGWLLGSAPIIAAAEAFVHAHPPTAPCMAEYGVTFPPFLASRTAADRVPYVEDFATLDWQLGRISVSADAQSLPLDALTDIPLERLGDVTLTLQAGLHHLAASWPIDTVMRWYLSETAPDQATVSSTDVRLELHGSRGDFQIRRLDRASFVFREGVSRGLPIGTAAERALIVDSSFDPGPALVSLFGDGLVVAARYPFQE